MLGATIIGGISFGAALGAYQGTVCAIRQVRGDYCHCHDLAPGIESSFLLILWMLLSTSYPRL